MKHCPTCGTGYPKEDQPGSGDCAPPAADAATLPSPALGRAEDGTDNDPPLRFCPLCGRQGIDTHSYGSPGTGRCMSCGTIFSVLASPARLPVD